MIEVTVFFDEDDLYNNEPARDYLMRYLLHHDIRGASVFAATMGFGRKHHVHKPKTLGGIDEESVMLIFVDEEDKVRAVLPHLKEVVREGLIIMKKAEAP